MATASVTPDQDQIVAEIFIAAPPERVFEAITTPEQQMQWWGQKGMYRIKEWTGDLRLGGKWESKGAGDDGKPFNVNGEYLEIDPPRLLVYTWFCSWAPALKSVVRWELQPQPVHGLHTRGTHKVGMGTLVKVHHSGFAAIPDAAASHSDGWKRVLGWMQGFVETGETVDSRPPVAIDC
jgi:uncharacterized protein YndB with AHSA1/START domain